MSVSLFRDVSALYDKSASTTIARHKIEYPALGKFCVSIFGFDSMLGEVADEDYWRAFLFPLRRLRFELCAAPFPREYRTERISTLIGELKHHLRFCRKLYPDFAGHAFSILDLLAELLDDRKNPLLNKLLELTNAEQNVAWVIKESRLIPHVEELVTGLVLPRLSIVHPLQLKNLTCYDHLIFNGPSIWFSEYVFTAARASQIDVLIFDWIKDRWKPQNVFISLHESSGVSSRRLIIVEEHETSSRWHDIDPESLLTIVEKTSSAVAPTLNNKGDLLTYENVAAVGIILEDDWAIFIEAGEGAKTLVIDPDEDIADLIARVPVKKILPGMFILVRTSGGGDYIVPVADKIMGDQAFRAREFQKRWKELLRNYVQRNGLFKTSVALLDYGSDLANEANVRNWMSPRSIRTRDYNDFLAIMRLVGLEDEAQEYWTMMERIFRAHQKASSEIRSLLLEQVKGIDVEALQKQGRMDFKLSSDDEGGLTAFRVESVLPETIEVPYFRIGAPVRLEEQLWRE